MSRSISLLIGLALIVSGCAATLEPAPEAYRVGGIGRSAAASAAGVYIVASAEAWRGCPTDLRGVVTPMLVTVDNANGTRPVIIRYNHFALETDAGARLAAVPPFQITGSVIEPVRMSYYPRAGFHVAPYLSPYYPGWSAFHGPFVYDPFYYDRYFPTFARVRLPTNDMIQRALPEGAIDPGGRIAGFVYFEEIPKHTKAVTFVAALVEAGTSTEFGVVRIPFVVD